MMNVRDTEHQNKEHQNKEHQVQKHQTRHHTLPLFTDVAEPPEGRQSKALEHDLKAHKRDRTILKQDLQRAGARRRRKPINPHLAAARRLSKDIRRLPDGSQEQTLTGRAICQHLRALLRETEICETGVSETELRG